MNHHLSRRNLLSLVLVFGLVQISFGHPALDVNRNRTPRAPRPFPKTKYIQDHDFDTLHVALDLRFDWEREQLIGIETMVFKPALKDLRAIEVDAANMTITSVKP